MLFNKCLNVAHSRSSGEAPLMTKGLQEAQTEARTLAVVAKFPVIDLRISFPQVAIFFIITLRSRTGNLKNISSFERLSITPSLKELFSVQKSFQKCLIDILVKLERFFKFPVIDLRISFPQVRFFYEVFFFTKIVY